MASCLGLYIEPHIIKYAKVSKDKDLLRIDSFGIKFYDRLGDAIKQVIADTVSFKIPISINLSEESYQYFYMFTLLNKNDLKKAIQTEFESFCADKNINHNALEARYALVNSLEDKEKVKVVHVSANKTAITSSEEAFIEYNVSTITPLSISISNVATLKAKENVLIINMEEETTLTTIVDQKIYQVDKIEEGSKQVLDSINIKENSYSKAYEICQNSTIYTMGGQELQSSEDENQYLEDIMPTLYNIANKVKDILSKTTIKIDRIFLTGTLSEVNNVDLYFQEFFQTEKCEILRPFFIKESVKVNLKDYIQVNSAIALALQGLGYGLKDINFKKQTLKDSINTTLSKLNIQTSKKSDGGTTNQTSGGKKINIDFSFKGKLDKGEVWLLRLLGSVLFLVLIYVGFVMFISSELDKKNLEIAEIKQDTQNQISRVEQDIDSVNSKANDYKQLSDNLKNISQQVAEYNKSKKQVPNFLTELMFSIPQGVQILSIETTNTDHVIINAQSEKYEQLGYFKAILKNKGILKPDTIISSAGKKQDGIIRVQIEGDLP